LIENFSSTANEVLFCFDWMGTAGGILLLAISTSYGVKIFTSVQATLSKFISSIYFTLLYHILFSKKITNENQF